jgi:transketolase
MSVQGSERELLAINTIRTLAMDAVEAAKSGHPGTPMALAPVAYVLFNDFLRYDPARPFWPNRDRFVLSCGHASMLLYAVLHLAGVRQPRSDEDPDPPLAVSLDEIRRFRQLHSRCPGHPEHAHTAGVETTTGPLGQGAGNSVGMAIAQLWLAEHFNRDGYPLFDYRVYALLSDGDMMEGVCSEAASLAGHLKLNNLCWIYDDNRITIEGETQLAFSEDVARRFEGYGWRVIRAGDVNDLEALRAALREFAAGVDRPTLIIVRSIIGYGAPKKANTAEAHGAPLGAEEVRGAKRAYGWPEDAQFLVPEGVRELFAEGIGRRGAALAAAWYQLWENYQKQFPDLAGQLQRLFRGELPPDWDAEIPTFAADSKGTATRNSSGKVLNQVGRRIPWLIGGSADLAPSNKTLLEFAEAGGSFSATNRAGRNLHFGIREHAMGAICNGLALCGLRAYAGTFLVFSDYMRPSIRLAAMMGLPILYIFTHDSIGVGEDGPTHQPVEQLAALRAIPHLLVIRPADANEVAEAYRVALGQRKRPVALILTRQDLPTLDRSKYGAASGLRRGAYILAEASSGQPQAIVLGSGSEVHICLAAREMLEAEGIPTRVVSVPCWELFEEQSSQYRQSVLPEEVVCRVGVEAGVALGWHRYLGPRGRFVGMSSFGASAPYRELYKHFGITPERVVAEVKAILQEVSVAS